MTQDTTTATDAGQLLRDQLTWARKTLEAFEAAGEGDSNDAEIDAALEMGQTIEAIIENPLVLAAPDLLAALRGLLVQTEAAKIVGPYNLALVDALGAAHAAIAKAEGR